MAQLFIRIVFANSKSHGSTIRSVFVFGNFFRIVFGILFGIRINIYRSQRRQMLQALRFSFLVTIEDL